jgi:hypothetical protein
VIASTPALADNVTIGSTTLTSNAPTLNSFAQNVPVFQGDTSGGYILSSPVDGRIVSWSFLSGGESPGAQYLLRVLRPQDMAGTMWTAEGTSAQVSVVGTAGVDAVQGPFVVSLPIKAGDRIALEPVGGADMPLETGVNGQDGWRSFLAPLADGASAMVDPANVMDFGQIVPIQATVAPAPVDTAPPAISGAPTVGNTLSCSPGTWDGAPTFAYQWLADGSPLGGETNPTHVIAPAEAGHQLTCAVTATNTGGSVTLTSAATDGVKPGAPPPPINTSPPAVGGTARQFETLSTTPGLWTQGVSGFAYQWLRCATAAGSSCAPIAGATAASYTLIRDDIGSTIRVQVTATNSFGSTTVTSAPTGIVQQGVITARLTVTPIETCTGLQVRLDGSGSVSPDGIAAYSITEVNMEAAALSERDASDGAFGNALSFYAGLMPAYELDQRLGTVFHQATVVTTFPWSRPEYPAYPGDPAGFQNLAVDPVGILLTVRDYAGATSTDRGLVLFKQQYSDESRASCPRSVMVVGRLVAAAVLGQRATVVSGAFGQTSAVATKLSCAQAVTCTGTLSIGPLVAHCRACARVGAKTPKRKPKAPTVYARSFFSIPAHHQLSVTAALTSDGRRLLGRLRHGGKRQLSVTVTSVGPAGTKVTRTSTIVIRRP